MQPCLELVTYTVTTPAAADPLRAEARDRAQALPGFAGWLPLCGATDPAARADLVVWTSPAAATAAAQVVGQGEDFAPFRASIAALSGIGHYALPAGGLPLLQPGEGVEIGRFRLRPGVTEAALRAAHARMITQHLAGQPGWRGQRLVQLQDGTWLDLALAESAAAARAICDSWAASPDCAAFLALIEPISMDFGTLA